MKNRIAASIIADSKDSRGNRVTTFVLTFPRIVLAEFNTHRMISKNSASSRAIPFKTMLKKVEMEPFVPIGFQRDHKGMQGVEYLRGPELIDAQQAWLDARDSAIASATKLSELNVTKQLCNRVLEPFLYHTVICTGTEWENFFALRAHGAAEIHIADLAEKMLVAYNESEPKLLKEGEWHIPFGDTFDNYRLGDLESPGVPLPVNIINWDKTKVKIATARCARVSYLNFEGKDDYNADIKLHDMLLASGHMSPFEHCARVMSKLEYEQHIYGKIDSFYPSEQAKGWSGNFKGFVQYRKTIQGENKTDERVKHV